MKRERLIPWIAVTLPVLFVQIGGAALYIAFGSTLRQEEMIAWSALFAVITVITILLSGYWGYSKLSRYHEQVRLRDIALREFNDMIEQRVGESVEAQRRKDRLGVQRSVAHAMEETVGLVTRRWREPLHRLAALPAAKGEMEEKVEMAALIAASMLRSLEEWEEFFRPDRVREPVDLSESIRRALSLLALEFAEAGIRVETQLECTMTLPLYRNEVVRVLISLLQNAKEVLIERRVELPRIAIECYETGQFIVIRLCDNAGGVEAGIADRVFEPYFSTKTRFRAAGLGLYMARNIVEDRCNGELTFDNIDDGACFYLKIGKHQEKDEV